MKRHATALGSPMRPVRGRSEPALGPMSDSSGETGSGGIDGEPGATVFDRFGGLPPRPRPGRLPRQRPPSGSRHDGAFAAQPSLQTILALLRGDDSRYGPMPVAQPATLASRRTTSADGTGRPPLPGNTARLPLLSNASLERAAADRLLADTDAADHGRLIDIVRQARTLRAEQQAEVVAHAGTRLLALLQQSVRTLSPPRQCAGPALHHALSAPTGGVPAGLRCAPLPDALSALHPESAASFAGPGAAAASASAFAALRAAALLPTFARDPQDQVELPLAPGFAEGVHDWADELATTDEPARRAAVWEKQLQRCAAAHTPAGAATIQRLAGQIADLPVGARRQAFASLTARLPALAPVARSETVALLVDVLGGLDLATRAEQFCAVCKVLVGLPGMEANQAWLPLVENLQLLAPQHRLDGFGFLLQRAGTDDHDPDQAYLTRVIGAVAQLPDEAIRAGCFDTFERRLSALAPDQRPGPVAALIDLIEHLPSGDLRWEKFAAMIGHALNLPEAMQAQAIDHLIQVFEHLPRGPHRLAAISHLLLLVRREQEPELVRHLAMLASRVPLVPPNQEMMGVFQCIGQIAQIASAAGRRAVLTAMACSLPELLPQGQLKPGVLVIFRLCATDHEPLGGHVLAVVEHALLRIAFDIERRLARPGDNALMLQNFSALLECAVVTPAPIRAKVVASIMTVLETACRQSAPAFDAMRASFHRVLAPEFQTELERRLTRLRPLA